MKTTSFARCPQTRRALRLLLDPNGPKIDQAALINALPGPTPTDPKALVDIIIQIILALMENKDKEDKPNPNNGDNHFSELRRVAADTAADTIDRDTLLRDLPKLITSIQETAARIPSPGFNSQRQARETMRINNNKALGASGKNWKLWNSAIRSEMDDLAFDEHLNNLVDYRNAWLAITDALAVVNDLARLNSL